MIMAASDNLGGQFGGRTPQEIPAHHRNAILNAIQSMGEQGMELVPGGMRVTPNDGGKSHFIPHNDSHLVVNGLGFADEYKLLASPPTEGERVKHFTEWGGSGTWLDGGERTASAIREEHRDDPATLWDRKHDQPLPEFGDGTDVRSTGSPRSYYTSERAREKNSIEALEMLPHLGGNPKTPAQHFYVAHNRGGGGIDSEGIEALKGLHGAYSRVYDVDKPPSVNPVDLTRGPFRSRDRHMLPVSVREYDDDYYPYNYNTSNGQITRRYHG